MDWAYLFTGLEGRLNRQPYWIGTIILIVVGVPLQFGAQHVGGQTLGLLVSLLFLAPGFALNLKRAYDRNRPAWVVGLFYALLIVIVVMQMTGTDLEGDEPTLLFLTLGAVWLLYAIWLVIELGFLRGTIGDNRYGPDPLGHA